MANPIKGMQRLTEEDVAAAAELLGSGLPADAARARLVERGMTPGLAEEAIRQAAHRELYAEAVAMLTGGARPDAVKAMLLERGVSPFVSDEIIQEAVAEVEASRPGPGPIRKVIGGVVVALGVGLWIGNMTGAFRTFPFLGFIVILIGLAVMGS